MPCCWARFLARLSCLEGPPALILQFYGAKYSALWLSMVTGFSLCLCEASSCVQQLGRFVVWALLCSETVDWFSQLFSTLGWALRLSSVTV